MTLFYQLHLPAQLYLASGSFKIFNIDLNMNEHTTEKIEMKALWQMREDLKDHAEHDAIFQRDSIVRTDKIDKKLDDKFLELNEKLDPIHPSTFCIHVAQHVTH